MHVTHLISRDRRGFTLIELLIVVAIIAILAAIAVPNFLEAQVRSKVSRAKSDMRTLATGLESYVIDYNHYPDVDRTTISPPIKLGLEYSRPALTLLSTPVSYITSPLLIDPFAVGSTNTRYYGYANCDAALLNPDLSAVGASYATVDNKPRFDNHRWVLQSVGPDVTNFALASPAEYPDQGFNNAYHFLVDPQDGVGANFIYDPTNGTVSVGDIVRTALITD
ncbi:prepilin-type N-terminal cleavage/methylation domain-containing protein [bacterium]|nr:prepilin-type N-terminal cleavage/methylation domain-containing protein [bacterium]